MVRTHAGRLEALAPLEQQHQLLEQVPDLVGLVAGDGDLVAPHVDLDAGERGLDDAQQLVALAEEVGHEVVAGDGDLDLGGRHEGTRLGTSPGRAARLGRGPPSVASRRCPRPPIPPASSVPRTGGWAARLERWAAEARVDAAAEARAREQWLRRQAEEEGALAGVLADLADGAGARAAAPPCRRAVRRDGPGRRRRLRGRGRRRVPRKRGGGGPGCGLLGAHRAGGPPGHRRPDRDVLAAAGGGPRRAGGRPRAGARGDRRRRDGRSAWRGRSGRTS